jgi:hypothetical protein
LWRFFLKYSKSRLKRLNLTELAGDVRLDKQFHSFIKQVIVTRYFYGVAFTV